MNGDNIGSRTTPPYEVSMDLSENLVNQSFTFQAIAKLARLNRNRS